MHARVGQQANSQAWRRHTTAGAGAINGRIQHPHAEVGGQCVAGPDYAAQNPLAGMSEPVHSPAGVG